MGGAVEGHCGDVACVSFADNPCGRDRPGRRAKGRARIRSGGLVVHGVMGVVSWIICVGSSGNQKWRSTVFASRIIHNVVPFHGRGWAWRQIVESNFLKFCIFWYRYLMYSNYCLLTVNQNCPFSVTRKSSSISHSRLTRSCRKFAWTNV